MKQYYQLMVVPGLADVVADEARERLSVGVQRLGRTRNHELLGLEWAGAPSDLLALRTVEDVFVALGRMPLSGRLSDMRALTAATWWGAGLQRALGVWSKATGKPLVKRLTWRVVVQADDVAWRQYRRQELTLTAERAVMNAGASWRINRDEAPLELWFWQVGRELVTAVRLTTNEQRQHGGREVERGAALRPTVAAAMVFLSGPEPGDVFLDPMCGAGTLLLERAAAGRYGLLVGGDSDVAAVEATLANFGPRHQPRRIERWDARRLPLEDASVTQVACNLPWGRQMGEKAEMPALYEAVLLECGRVVRPGGRLVLLTSEWEALKGALKHGSGLRIERTVSNVEVLGRRADIFVVRRV